MPARALDRRLFKDIGFVQTERIWNTPYRGNQPDMEARGVDVADSRTFLFDRSLCLFWDALSVPPRAISVAPTIVHINRVTTVPIIIHVVSTPISDG
jgi:hypothetical protein